MHILKPSPPSTQRSVHSRLPAQHCPMSKSPPPNKINKLPGSHIPDNSHRTRPRPFRLPHTNQGFRSSEFEGVVRITRRELELEERDSSESATSDIAMFLKVAAVFYAPK